MVRAATPRASGQTGATEEAKEEAGKLEEQMTVTLPEEEKRYQLRTPKFSRMRFDWATPEDRAMVDRARLGVDNRIMREYRDAFNILYQIYVVIREPEVDPHSGEIRHDQFGYPIWKRTPDGFYVEDFTALTRKQMEHYVGLLTLRMFEWEQTAADLAAEALFAKAQYEERFAIAFDAPMSGTVDDRRAAGNRDAMEEKYFAIYLTHLSKRADAIVRSADRLGQRLKDILTS